MYTDGCVCDVVPTLLAPSPCSPRRSRLKGTSIGLFLCDTIQYICTRLDRYPAREVTCASNLTTRLISSADLIVTCTTLLIGRSDPVGALLVLYIRLEGLVTSYPCFRHAETVRSGLFSSGYNLMLLISCRSIHPLYCLSIWSERTSYYRLFIRTRCAY